MHPELKETLLTVGNRDVDLLNAGNGSLILREPYFDWMSQSSCGSCLKGS